MPAHDPSSTPVDATLPLALIEEVVAEARVREKRRRLLPAAAVMVLVLGLCLFAGDSYGEVARKLAGWLRPLARRQRWRVPGSSALAKARRRLGAAPFELLFTRLASPLAGPGTPGAAAFGRRLILMSVDGALLDVPHTPANIAAFGPPPSAGGFPQVRLLTLIGCGTRGLAGAVFGPRKTSEQELAEKLAARGVLARGMLALADRNFAGHATVAALTSTGAGVLIRVKAERKLPVLEELPDGSYRSMLADPAQARRRYALNGKRRRRGSKLPPDTSPIPGIPVRVIDAHITATPAGGPPRTQRFRLITTLLDPAEAPAAELAATYAQRWESETGYQELKTFLRGAGRVLRSTTPDGIKQETWALLCTHQLIQQTRAHAAARRSIDPDRISYTIPLRAVRRELTTSRRGPAARRATISEILAQLLPPHRRRRSYPRMTRASTARRRKARATLTGTITYKITISGPPSSRPGP
ncbi:MAG TPA: IS4 family transposase [Candidatus Eisenbacteria bacterium]|nr:IS4 family transposase [Candidatus Eisenbacteria bacterium]